MQYPVYRKYPHNKTFFKIHSAEEFEELSIMGKKYSLNHFKAKIHPDRMYIFDLLHNYHSHYIAIDKDEYERILKESEQTREHVAH